MKNTCRIVSFVCDKGGVGKSTLNILFANHLAYEKDKKVLLVDADTRHSIKNVREKDINEWGCDPKLMYPIKVISPVELKKKITLYQQEFEYIIIDLPGSLLEPGVLTTYTYIDNIIIPVNLSLTLEGGMLEFYNIIKNEVSNLRTKNKYNPPTLHGIVNNVDVRTKTTKRFIEGEKMYEFEMIKNFIPTITLMKDNLTTAGIFKKHEKYPQMEDCFDEIYHITENYNQRLN